MSIKRLPPALRWIGFDLDDTLHFYKKASGAAANAVFQYIEDEFGTAQGRLAEEYRAILRQAQSRCFAQGKTSREYRAERFGALLTRFSIIPHRHLDAVLDLYDETLAERLELKEGAEQVLRAAKAAGLLVMVVTEGPHDAQETTLRRLGISRHVDLLVTSAMERISKAEGLLGIALQKAQCASGEMIYVGDSLQSDILPARKLGVQSFYVGEETAVPEDITRLASLMELKPLLEDKGEV